MTRSGKSLPEWLDLNLKEMDPIHRKVLYWNILFPGAGFAYAGDSWRLILYGGGAMILLLTGALSSWLAVRPAGLSLTEMLSRMMAPLILLGSVVVVHVAAIFASTRARTRNPSKQRATFYVVCCALISGASIILLLLEIWRQALL